MSDFFWLTFGGLFALNALVIGYLFWRGVQRRRIFPKRDTVNILFEEKRVSGSFGRFGYANNCLQVTVTDTELWITTSTLIGAFAGKFDLLHRIPRTDILRLTEEGKHVVVEFSTSSSPANKFELRLNNPAAFLAALADEAA